MGAEPATSAQLRKQKRKRREALPGALLNRASCVEFTMPL